MWNFVLTVALPIIREILEKFSPELRRLLCEFAMGLYGKAKATPNPYDDIAAALLLDLLGLETPVDNSK